VRSPFLRRRAPLDALKRLVGLLERTVHQASGGFKGFGEGVEEGVDRGIIRPLILVVFDGF
jgi:hypothetical protein